MAQHSKDSFRVLHLLFIETEPPQHCFVVF